KQSLSGGTVPELRDTSDIHIELVPEKAADGIVGAWIKRSIVQKSSQQRQCRDRRAAELACPAQEGLQVSKIAAPPASLRVQSIERQEDAPGFPFRHMGRRKGQPGASSCLS